jgi:2-oxoglutarate ferredoxin oxidoreductase subunit alpha
MATTGSVQCETSSAGPSRKKIEEAVIRLAGQSQDGIQAIGGFLARLAGRSEQEVMTYMTIPSTISGGPSIFQVRMGSGEVLSPGDEADFLVAFYQFSYNDHIGSLREGGIVLYDSDHVKPNPDLERKYHHVGVAITGMTVEAIGGTGRDKGKNILVLGLLAKVFDLDTTKLKKLIEERFRGKDESVVRNNLSAFHVGYSQSLGNILETFQFLPSTKKTTRKQVVMDGTQAIAYGALAAGVRFGAGYPITPWSGIMEILRAELPKYGGIFMQAEDELAAIGIAIGASYAGHVALTGSSGPGISLKTESIGWAVMAEVPLIVIDVQRGGPSTGLPTNVEQSDLNIAIFGGHGDSPRVVLAPCNVEDSFYTMIEAVNIAREYSVPVFVLTDQAIATRIEAFEEPDLAKVVQEVKPDLTPRSADFLPYEDTPTGITHHAPPGTFMLGGKYPNVTGLEHDAAGHPSGKPIDHTKMTAKRRRKLQTLAARLPVPKVYGPPEGNILIVGWGSTRGPICEAVDKARANGDSVSSLHLKHLNPLPNGLENIFDGFNHILVAELNDEGLYGYGQLGGLLRARFCNPKIRGLTKTDGLPFKVREILSKAQANLTSGMNKL